MTRASSALGPTGIGDVGALYTYVPSSVAPQDIYQVFIPQYSAANRARIHFRKAVDASNWDIWFRVAGGHDGSATFDPPNLAAGTTQQTMVTVTSAEVGDYCNGAFSNAHADIVWLCSVTAAATATVTQWNRGAGAVDLASGTLRVMTTKQ